MRKRPPLTVGPMKAARTFVNGLREHGHLDGTTRVRAELYGSLALTGRGHGSDTAVVLGLMGHTPEHVVRKLREGERLLNEGKDLVEVLRHLEISEATWNRWRSQYGGMKANEAKRLKELEAENARLKKLVANQALDIDMLKEISAGNF